MMVIRSTAGVKTLADAVTQKEKENRQGIEQGKNVKQI